MSEVFKQKRYGVLHVIVKYDAEWDNEEWTKDAPRRPELDRAVQALSKVPGYLEAAFVTEYLNPDDALDHIK